MSIELSGEAIAASPGWQKIATEAQRKRVRIELRRGPDAHPVRAMASNRGGADFERVGDFDTPDQAIAALDVWLGTQPLPGPDALREELRTFGRRLAMARPGDFAKKSGADVPLYRDFRDRILPLAWDNLVESVRVEALEDFVRRVGALPEDPRLAADEDAIAGDAWEAVVALAAEARGLVAPKET